MRSGRIRIAGAVVAGALGMAIGVVHAQRVDSTGDGRHVELSVDVPPAPPLSPEQEQATFVLQDGFRTELVASEPLVQDPVAIDFDEDGRMWVVEMRGFMPDIKGTGEGTPNGRISVLTDDDGDGRADRAEVFLDGLVLPRALAVTGGGALVVHGEQLYFAKDEDGDGKADRHELVDADYGEGGENPEHAPNGLLRAMDNWHYNAESTKRYRWREGRWVRELVEPRGQWGLTQDDFGRLYYNYNYDQLRCDLAPPGALLANRHHKGRYGAAHQVTADQRVFPIRPTTGVNRGYRPGELDQRGRLVKFTAASGPVIFRGDAFPAEYSGNAFVPEPAGNLVKRTLVEDDLRPRARQAYEDREFWAATDERFRPVYARTAPDGTLFVVDMYRGLIQHREYLTTYLKQQVLARGLERPLHRGRIWRVVGPEGRRGPRPRLSAATNRELVAHLGHRNGWWRDTAQRLLVERGARDVRGDLVRMALRHPKAEARAHAVWTLEGLAGVDGGAGALLPMLADRHPRVRVAAVHALTRLASGDPRLKAGLLARTAAWPRRDKTHALHAALALGRLGDADQRLRGLLDIAVRAGDDPLLVDAVMAGAGGLESKMLERALAHAAFRRENNGRGPLLRLLASAVASEGDPARVSTVLDLAGRETKAGGDRTWRARMLMAGLAHRAAEAGARAIRLSGRPPALAVMEESGDGALTTLVARAETILAWPGHEAKLVEPLDPKALPPVEQASVYLGQMHYFHTCAGCHGITGEGVEPLGPPLAGSEWVQAPAEVMMGILLLGLEGPIHVRGELYEPPRIMPSMPGVADLRDDVLAGLISFVRFKFANLPVEPLGDRIHKFRARTQGREAPYTYAEVLPWLVKQETAKVKRTARAGTAVNEGRP
jgi:glucose/arabinose dehydrogenase/mono/diheme cytochrome c family protein